MHELTVTEVPSKTALITENSTNHTHVQATLVKKINNANSKQRKEINDFIERELKWLDSDEYIIRKKAATDMSESEIGNDVKQIKEQLAKTEINFLYEKAIIAAGVYSQDIKKPIINIFRTDNQDLTSRVIDHEIKHALSEQSLETMDDLLKVFTSKYRNYPRINNKRIQDYLIPGETLGTWANNATEQQVISKRIMDYMESNYEIKRGTQLATPQIKQLTKDLNYQIKQQDQTNGDVIVMLYKMKQKHKDSYQQLVCEMVNKAY
jgi:hypothetical protein